MELSNADLAARATVDRAISRWWGDPVVIRLRKKYRMGAPKLKQEGLYLKDIAGNGKGAGIYRNRTGPDCCNAGCRSSRGKGPKQTIRRGR